MKLLIADDHAGVRKFVRELVGKLAADICECTNGEEAARMCAELLPDFVIIDLQMPGADGFEIGRAHV